MKGPFKVLVGCKRVIDYAVKVRIAPNRKGVEDGATVKHSMNPFDEIALEEAIRLRDKLPISEIIAISCGPPSSQETIRSALALGADRGIHVPFTNEEIPLMNSQLISKIFKEIITKEGNVGLVMLGKQAIDSDSAQTGPMLAGLLNWSQALFASNIQILEGQKEEDISLIIDSDVDSGIERHQISLPSVVTADLRLNKPRYATLPNIMKAKRKVIETMDILPKLLQTNPHYITTSFMEPPKRKKGSFIEVKELVEKIRNL